jgi:hypothetical protein
MNARYFTSYCGRGPYEEIWLDHSGAANCVATLRRMRARVGSLLVLGTATGQVLAHFERELGVRPHGCEISAWAHARIPARHRSRVERADLRRFVPRLARAERHFDLIFCNALIYLEPRDLPAVLEAASRIGAWFHCYSSTSEDHEPGDRDRVTLRPRAWWRARFLEAGWVPTRSRYLWRSTVDASVPG